MRLAGTLVLTLLIATLSMPAGASRPISDPNYAITTEKLNDTLPFHWPICLDTTSDTLYGWDRINDALDYYDGAAWQEALDLAAHPSTAEMRRIFIDSSGNIFFSFVEYGKLYKVTREPYALADSFAFVNDDADFMYMSESDSFLYVGEYTPLADTSAHIWRSVDSGANWQHLYHDADADHVHFVIADPYRDDNIYAAMGDGLANSSLIKSVDAGINWSTILDTDVRSQATDMLFLYDTRLFGMDCRLTDRDSTGVFLTTDDSAFVDTMDLVAPYDAHIYAMTMNADSTGFAATFRRNGTTNTLGIYRMRDDKSWWRVKNLGSSSVSGVWDMTDFGSDGYAYYSDRANGGVWKFKDAPMHTVGDGGEFATIADALAGTKPGDTITLLAGSHTASDENVHDNMTIQGYSGDYDDVIVWTAGANLSCFLADSTATFKDFTFRTITRIAGIHSTLFVDFDTADVVYSLEHVRDPEIDSPTASVIAMVDTIEAVDRLTVKMTLSAPYADLPLQLMDYRIRMIPEGSADTIGKTGIGTGPFILVTLDPEGTTVLKANPDYWEGPPGVRSRESSPVPSSLPGGTEAHWSCPPTTHPRHR